MNRFTRQYIALSVLLVAGVSGSLVTPLGGDPRIGTFSAGLTIGVLVALYMLRIAELQGIESEMRADGSERSEVADLSAESAAGESGTGPLEASAVVAQSNILQFRSAEPVIDAYDVELQEDEEYDELCSCACECEWRSKDDGFGLCGNCQRWWFQQSARCTCGYDKTGTCSCGAVKHRPTHLEEEFLRAA